MTFRRAAHLWMLTAALGCPPLVGHAAVPREHIPPRVQFARSTVHVKGYYRKDGTYVRPHQSHTPGSGSHGFRSPAPHRSPAPGSHAGGSPRQRSNEPLPGPGPAPRDANGRIVRSQAAKDAFRRTHPCPCTGRTTGPCPGYVIDHIKALKRGGADRPENMQWQTVEAAKLKDMWE